MSPRTPLLRPAAFFERRRATAASGLAVVAGFWLWSGVLVYAFVSTTVSHVGDPAARAQVRAALPGALVGAMVPLGIALVLGWLVAGGVVHLAARWRGGRGSYGRALAVVGWGFATAAVTATVGMGAMVARNLASDYTLTAPGRVEAQLDAVFGTLGPLSSLLGVVATLWAAYVWAGGLTVTHDMEVGDAAVAAGAVALVSLALGAL